MELVPWLPISTGTTPTIAHCAQITFCRLAKTHSVGVCMRFHVAFDNKGESRHRRQKILHLWQAIVAIVAWRALLWKRANTNRSRVTCAFSGTTPATATPALKLAAMSGHGHGHQSTIKRWMVMVSQSKVVDAYQRYRTLIGIEMAVLMVKKLACLPWVLLLLLPVVNNTAVVRIMISAVVILRIAIEEEVCREIIRDLVRHLDQGIGER